MGKRILVSVSNDLITDQRVDKVSCSLYKNGYEVCLIGCIKNERKLLQRAYRTFRFNLFFKRKFIFYLEYNLRLFFLLLFSRKDLLLCNDTDALPANYLASLLTRTPLIFDAHELFPEVPEVVGRPQVKKVWEAIEGFIFPHLKFNYTVCQSIADYYRDRYGIEMGVVRNIAPLSGAKEESQQQEIHFVTEKVPLLASTDKKILLYQGAVNVGRGIEWLIGAMPYLDDCLLCICGNGDLFADMQKLAAEKGVDDRVFFTGRIPFEELNRYTRCADLGFVLLENCGLSYYYSMPNRIFDYMRYGVPVLASDFPEIARIVETYQTGKLISHYEPEYLAQTIRNMLVEWDNQPTFKQRLNATSQLFSWENEEKVLLEIVKKAEGSQ